LEESVPEFYGNENYLINFHFEIENVEEKLNGKDTFVKKSRIKTIIEKSQGIAEKEKENRIAQDKFAINYF
jgi:hypothetical protein